MQGPLTSSDETHRPVQRWNATFSTRKAESRFLRHLERRLKLSTCSSRVAAIPFICRLSALGYGHPTRFCLKQGGQTFPAARSLR
jgi:hypothetical protein